MYMCIISCWNKDILYKVMKKLSPFFLITKNRCYCLIDSKSILSFDIMFLFCFCFYGVFGFLLLLQASFHKT